MILINEPTSFEKANKSKKGQVEIKEELIVIER